jgi:hypothetical protein
VDLEGGHVVNADDVERELFEQLAAVMVESADQPGLITRLDVLDNLAGIGARAVAVRDDAEPAEVTLVAALNDLPPSLLEDEPISAIGVAIGAAARRHGVMLVRDSFDDAVDDYFGALP